MVHFSKVGACHEFPQLPPNSEHSAMLKACTLLSICCVSALAALPAAAGDLLNDGQLRVITYNVQFLPGVAAVANKRGNPNYRATTIGKELAKYDIVGINELFEAKPREMLIGEIKQAWNDQASVIVSPNVQPKRFTGGLAIVSRFPFLETNIHTYTQSSDPKKYGFLADGYATKGILHARIALSEDRSPEKSIDVFVTHMEAREDAIRPSQYVEFADFVRQHSSPSRPVIMMGDFNTRGGEQEMRDESSAYHQMTGKYSAARPESEFIDLWTAVGKGPGGTSDQLKEDGGRRIDYIFVLNPKTPAPALRPIVAEVNRFLDPEVEALSDHNAVQAVLQWQPAGN